LDTEGPDLYLDRSDLDLFEGCAVELDLACMLFLFMVIMAFVGTMLFVAPMTFMIVSFMPLVVMATMFMSFVIMIMARREQKNAKTDSENSDEVAQNLP
jgi:membrane protein implicated in regulation of membrane protease activity